MVIMAGGKDINDLRQTRSPAGPSSSSGTMAAGIVADLLAMHQLVWSRGLKSVALTILESEASTTHRGTRVLHREVNRLLFDEISKVRPSRSFDTS